MVAKIQGTVTIDGSTMEIEPVDALEDWGIDPDSIANLVTALQRNAPDGQYFFKLTLDMKPVPV